MSPTEADDPVVVVGAGPTGVTAALLLARLGVRVVVVERYAEPWPLPRAVHLDDEVHRLLQRAGVAEAFAAVSRPARGMRLVDRQLRVLAEFDRTAAVGRHGWPQANLFDQPDLEALLRAELDRQPLATLRTGVEVVDVRGGRTWDELPRAHLSDVATGERTVLRAAAVLGCDGAGGLVRGLVGGGWEDLGFAQEWLVVDVRCAVPLGHWEGVHQVCDPVRAATFLRVGDDRYRWEFQLRPGERADQLCAPDVLSGLLAPWTAGVPAERLELVRAAGYLFEAGAARRWRTGRLFLLGDAAHLTPPFVGQGLGSGLRDAGNLSWKLAGVLRGEAPEQLLDTYAAERRAHTRSLVRLAVLLGRAMTGGRQRADVARRAVLAVVRLLPRVDGLVLDVASPPLVAGPLVARRRLPRRLVGTLVPQPRVRGGARLDDVLGPGFAVLTRVAADPDLSRLAARLDASLLDVRGLDPGGVLPAWLARARATAVVVRPDRTVLLSTRSRSAPGRDLLARGRRALDLVSVPAGSGGQGREQAAPPDPEERTCPTRTSPP